MPLMAIFPELWELHDISPPWLKVKSIPSAQAIEVIDVFRHGQNVRPWFKISCKSLKQANKVYHICMHFGLNLICLTFRV